MEQTGSAVAAELRIRPCLETDLADIQAIYAHYVLHSTATFEETPPGVDFWQRRFEELSEAGLPFLVGTLDGRLVAYSYCSKWRPRPAYRFTGEDSIYVAPDMVGRGIGARMLPELLAKCRGAGLRRIIAVISTGDSDASVKLHSRCGFVNVGCLDSVGYKFDRWLDTVVMQLALD